MVYEKALHLHTSNASIGQVFILKRQLHVLISAKLVNIISSDSQRLWEFAMWHWFCILVPYTCIAILVFLFMDFGLATIPGTLQVVEECIDS